MNAEEKTAWIDEENKIVLFRAIDKGWHGSGSYAKPHLQGGVAHFIKTLCRK